MASSAMLIKTVQGLWIGGSLSKIEQLSIASFLQNGCDYDLYVYSDVANVPAGVTIKDAAQIIPQSEIFTYAHNNRGYSAFANWFRYELLYQRGGVWVDLDVVCLRPLTLDEPILFGYENPQWINNAVLRFPKQHHIMRIMAKLAKNPNRWMPYDSLKTRWMKIKRWVKGNHRGNIRFGETGPKGLTKVLKHYNLTHLACPTHYFYPVHHSSTTAFYESGARFSPDCFENAYTLHLWNDIARRAGIDKNATFAEDTLIEQLKRRYGVLNQVEEYPND